MLRSVVPVQDRPDNPMLGTPSLRCHSFLPSACHLSRSLQKVYRLRSVARLDANH